MRKKHHAAIVTIQDETLLEMLDFEGGKIISISRPSDIYNPNSFDVMIEHPDLPKVIAGCTLETFKIRYEASLRGYKRTSPEKKYRRVRVTVGK